MKQVKNNLRSFRYSDKVAEILEQSEGVSLNEKFENLVLTCYMRLPEIQEEIKTHEAILEDLKRQCREMYLFKNGLQDLERAVADVTTHVKKIRSKLEDCNT